MVSKLRAFLDKIPHWIYVGLALFFGTALSQLENTPDLLSALTTWDWPHIEADIQASLVVAFWAVVGWLKTDPWTAKAKLAASAQNTAKIIFPVLLFLCLAHASTACHAGPLSPPPPNLPPDAQAELDCVIGEIAAGDFQVATIAAKCTKNEIQIAIDLLDWLFSNLAYAEAHQKAIIVIKPQLTSWKKDGHL